MNNQHIEEKGGGSWWLYVTLLVLGLIIGYTAGSDRSSKEPAVAETPKTEGASYATSTSAAVIINDQNAGLEVELTEVVLDKSGWVAIHEDAGGALGNILGAQLFDAGEGKGTVSLLRATDPGKTYYAVVYTDNGDRQFDRVSDLKAVIEGKEIMTVFHTIEKGLPIRNESSE